MTTTIGERIQNLREGMNLTKRELARLTGVSDVAVGYWENGVTREIGHTRIIAMCKLFGCTADSLLGIDEEE